MSTIEILDRSLWLPDEDEALTPELAHDIVMADFIPGLFRRYDDLRRRALLLGGPQIGLDTFLNDWREENLSGLLSEIPKLAIARLFGIGHFFGSLFVEVVRGDGDTEDLGLVSMRVVTDVGCQKIVAVMNTSDAATATTFKYHGLGTGTTAEAAGDTALVTELTTEYVGNTRATGTQTTGATTKVYRTVGAVTLDSGTPAITEHGAFSAASAGSLLDRSKFAAINLDGTQGDGLTATYDFTTVSGS